LKTPNKNILHLTLKKEFFDQVKKGEKTSEYREYKPYWIKRLMNDDRSFKEFDYIYFRNGYNKNAPDILIEFLGIKILKRKIGLFRTEKVFEIKLGKTLN
jgi:hypothetical protein